MLQTHVSYHGTELRGKAWINMLHWGIVACLELPTHVLFFLFATCLVFSIFLNPRDYAYSYLTMLYTVLLPDRLEGAEVLAGGWRFSMSYDTILIEK